MFNLSMKKVLYIVHSSQMGGATISFLNMVCSMKKVGYVPFVVYPDYNDVFIKMLDDNGIEHEGVKLTPLILHLNSLKSKLLYPYHYARLFLRLKITTRFMEQLVQSVKPDIIHTNTGIIHEGYFAARKFGIPHVWHLREYQDLDFGWHIFPSKKAFIHRLSNSYVIAISRGIFNHFKLSAVKDKVIYNGILSENDIAYISVKKKYFLCASRIVASKGHEDVVKAFAVFCKQHPDYRLIILGDGHKQFISKLRKQAYRSGCLAQIDFKGHRTVQETVKFMREAKALIVASKFEGFGRMTAEAAFAGCVVIGRATGGTKEIIDMTGGMLFHDITGLIQAMNEVASMDENSYSHLVLQGQRLAVENYSIERNIHNIAQYYSFIQESPYSKHIL